MRLGFDRPPRLAFAARGHCGQSWGVLSRTSTLGGDAQRERVRRGGRWSAHGDVAAARPTAGRLQSIPSDPHVMQVGAARLRGRPHGMLRARVVLDRAAAWTRLGVHVARGLQPQGHRRGWREWVEGWGAGVSSTNTVCA